MGKKTFLASKMWFWQTGAISIFAKGLTQDFPQNFERSFKSHFFLKRSRHDVEYCKYVKGLSALQKCYFNIVGQCPIVGHCPMSNDLAI